MARNSELILCSGIRLDREYSNVVDYSESDMLSLCRTNKIGGDSNYSFIRSESRLVTSIPYGTALQGNYIAFQNPDYSNKWFFAFVDDVKYVNDNSTEIFYTIDQFSTWFRNLTLNDCLVVREHTNDDSIGANTIPENIDIGDVVAESETIDTSFNSYYIIIESDYDIENDKDFNRLTFYNGQFLSHYIAMFPFTMEDNQTNRFWISQAKQYFIGTIVKRQASFINNIYVIPQAIVLASDTERKDVTYHILPGDTGTQVSYFTIKSNASDTFSPEYFDVNIAKLRSFSDYPNVKNNKLFVYPYNYLYVTNNVGNSKIYKYEDFSDSNNATFQFVGAWQIGGSGRMIPKNYKTKQAGNVDNCDESLPLGKYPTFNWSSDAFTNWLTQNGVNMTTGAFASGLATAGAIGGAIATGGASIPLSLGIATSTSGNYFNTLGSLVQASMQPNIEGGQNTSDVTYSADLNNFVFKRMRPKVEYLRIIDDFFSAVGYKTNRMKIPNITGRAYWNYVEIASSDSIGHGSIPADALNTINNAFHQGVTIWHNHSNIGNYELDNSIV